MTSSELKDFQQFIRNDPQLKAFGQCFHPVNLFELSSDSNSGHYSQRPNRTALVVVRVSFTGEVSTYIYSQFRA